MSFLASGVVFVSSSVFQGMGNTLPVTVQLCVNLWLLHREFARKLSLTAPAADAQAAAAE